MYRSLDRFLEVLYSNGVPVQFYRSSALFCSTGVSVVSAFETCADICFKDYGGKARNPKNPLFVCCCCCCYVRFFILLLLLILLLLFFVLVVVAGGVVFVLVCIVVVVVFHVVVVAAVVFFC